MSRTAAQPTDFQFGSKSRCPDPRLTHTLPSFHLPTSVYLLCGKQEREKEERFFRDSCLLTVKPHSFSRSLPWLTREGGKRKWTFDADEKSRVEGENE